MSNFKVIVVGGVIVGVAAAPVIGKDANGMVNDLAKYTGLIANATSSGSVVTQMYQSFETHDGSGKTVEAPARPIRPVVRYRLS
jgi:hypothetical protein